MDPITFIHLITIAISLTLSVIFFMAWSTMGRKPYTFIWGVAFLVVCAQKVLNIGKAYFPSFELYWIVVCSLSVLTVILGCWGHMLRTKVKTSVYYLFTAGGLAVLVTAYFSFISPHVGLRMSVYILQCGDAGIDWYCHLAI